MCYEYAYDGKRYHELRKEQRKIDDDTETSPTESPPEPVEAQTKLFPAFADRATQTRAGPAPESVAAR